MALCAEPMYTKKGKDRPTRIKPMKKVQLSGPILDLVYLALAKGYPVKEVMATTTEYGESPAE